MSICDNIVHPFHSDEGISQRRRAVDTLLTNAPLIDGRTMADLLDYFVQLSGHINFYDSKLSVSDWRPFFQKSPPFTLATIVKYDRKSVAEKFDLYNKLFDKHPSNQSLQLLLHFIFHYSVNRINTWHTRLKGSELPVLSAMDQLIKDKLQQPLRLFIAQCNTASKWYKTKRIDFIELQANSVWGLSESDLRKEDVNFLTTGITKRKRLLALRDSIRPLMASFVEVIRLFSTNAGSDIELSLFPLKEELKKLHTPHLGLLFAFLKLFQHLQKDLNGYTRKHLDYFYHDVLKLQARGATGDKAHIIVEIQNLLDQYPLKKGLLVKDGKDSKKAEILFSLDEEIVANKTEVADLRTLFLQHASEGNIDFVQGTYMAPDARKADGVKIDFKDSDPKNVSTLGSKYSKYKDPEQKFIKPYPIARLGFILASPVLMLQEGYRTIDINLACELNDVCAGARLTDERRVQNCCEGNELTVAASNDPCRTDQSELLGASPLFESVKNLINQKYYYVSKDLITQAIKKGLGGSATEKLFDILRVNRSKICYCPSEEIKYDALLSVANFESRFIGDELKIVNEFFKPQYPLKITFSGEKSWIESDPTDAAGNSYDPFVFTALNTLTGRFNIRIKSIIKADKPAISFYDKDKLKEDFGTTQPLAKIELNDFIKLQFTKTEFQNLLNNASNNGAKCCLLGEEFQDEYLVSLYHFFRNVLLSDTTTDKTTIKVTVCGLKNFIVQNDESVQDVNAPIYPFGTRPDIIDFDVNHTLANTVSIPGYPNPVPNPRPNLIGPNFFIGSKEVFLKNWDSLCVRINWKDKPVDFNDYYTPYIKRVFPNPGDPSNPIEILGLNENDFHINLALLQNGKWEKEKSTSGKVFNNTITGDFNRRLFAKENCGSTCINPNPFEHSYFVERRDFPGIGGFSNIQTVFGKVETGSQLGFIRINLQNQDFLHKDYAYVLARQMMAIGKFPEKGVEGAIYLGTGGAVIVFKDTGTLIVQIESMIIDTAQKAGFTKADAQTIISRLGIVRNPGSAGGVTITNTEFLNQLQNPTNSANTNATNTKTAADSVVSLIALLKPLLSIFKPNGELVDELSVPIPSEPWTPVIKNMALDYTATATVTDIDLIHLYPFDQTYKSEELQLKPALVPTFCNEGNLFIGLKKLKPGSNVAILFQLAEATADSESEREEVQWHYLDNNIWKELRKGFEVLDDDTNGLTTSGIVKFLMPANMTSENTILPKGLHWIKASIPKNSKVISETIGIHAQAVKVSFTNEEANDKLRLSGPLAEQSINKLKQADSSIKKISQPYESFGGRIPEIEGEFYTRASEWLRHKGRAVQKFDYERLVLEAFPQIFKAKCINHSYGLNAHKYNSDFLLAPGFVLVAVIPDLNRLKAGESFEPRVPVSILEKIFAYLCQRTSAFVRLKVMNPRYEKVHFCIKVKLYPGKDEVFYKSKLQQDLREFLAPWAVGEYDKLSFGQCINRSDIIEFLETRDYIDYILELAIADDISNLAAAKNAVQVCPQTPRSILIAGDVDICIKQDDCEQWNKGETCANKAVVVMDYCSNLDPIIT